MNRHYRSIWNDITQTFVAAAEIVRQNGKQSNSESSVSATVEMRGHYAGMMALEQRFMFDGAAVIQAAHAMPDQSALAVLPDTIAPVLVRAADPTLNQGKKEVVFVDTSVTNYKILEAAIKDGLEVEEISSNASGLAQIAKWALTHQDYDAVHIISHGSEAVLNLGTDAINESALSESATKTELALLGHALKEGGDLLIYGCDIGEAAPGKQFVTDLSILTGLDVAASDNPTGNISAGGDWNLEIHQGNIDTAIALDSVALRDFNALLTAYSGTVDFSNYTNAYGAQKDPWISAGSSNYKLVLHSSYVYSSGSSEIYVGNFLNSTSASLGTTGTSGPSQSTFFSLSFTQISGNSAVTFDPQSLKILDLNDRLGGSGQISHLQFTGYDAAGNIVGTSKIVNASSIPNNSWTYSVDLSGLGRVSTIKITDPDNTYAGSVLSNFFIDDLAVTNVQIATVSTPTTIVTTANLSSDTGSSSSDFITKTASQTISGTLSANLIAGERVEVSYNGGSTWSSATSSTGSNTWSATTTLSGSNTFEARVTNSGGSSTAYTHAYTLDTTSPAAPGTPDMTSVTDTGASNTDNITSNTTPVFTGTAEANSTVNLYDSDGTTLLGTATADGSGNWSITSSALSEGTHTLTAKATDAAGNTSVASSSLSVTIDTTAPTVTVASAAFSADTGTSSTDFITKTAAQTISGTLSANLSSGETVYVSLDNGGTWTAATTTVGQNTWSLSGQTLTASNTLKVRVSDAAGNNGTAYSQIYVLDTTAPTTTVATKSFSADTGASSTDFITKTAAQTISGTLSANVASGEVVYVSLDNGATWAAATTSVGANTWSLSGQTLTGSNTLKVKVTDAAGNDGTVSSQVYVLDTTAPAAPSTPDMTSGTDSGASNTDNITNNTTPVFTGTAEAGSTVTLYDTDGTTVLGTATATGGNWSITSSTLSAGSHTLTAKSTDAAGNTSVASSGLGITVDTTAPTSLALSTTTVATSSATSTSTIATLSASDTQSITYALATGNGTNDADNGSFTITGTSLKVGGSALSAGTYHVYVAATDVAGNVANQAFTITVVNAPSVSSVVRAGGASATVLQSASSVSYTVTFSESVTGVDASDFALTATGTASGSIASVTGSGTTYTVTVNTLAGDGTLRLDLNGSGTGIQNATSVAIASGYTSGATYTLDHTAPASPSTPDMTSATDTGTSSTDNITSNTTPVFTGTAESGSTVTLYDTDGTTVLGTTTATGGTWSITSSALSAGNHTLSVKATDSAGNTSVASSGLSVNVDTSAPVSVALSASSVADTAATSGTTVATLSATDANNVSYALVTGNGTNDANNASFTIAGTNLRAASNLTAGTYHILVRATDAAGNTSDQAFTITVTAGPSVASINRSVATALTNASSVDFTVTFSESVTGVDTSDFVLTSTGTVGGTIASITGSGSTYTVTVNNLSGDGTLRLDLNNSGTGIVNAGTQAITGGFTSGQSYTLDTTAPTAPTGLDMIAASDSGSSNTDNITSVTTPVITGGGAEAGATVTLYDTDGTTVLGTATADGSGNWSITSSTLSSGTHTLTTKVTDAADNTGPASTGLAVTIDTTAPSASGTPDLASASDSGSSNTDNITSVTTPVITGGGAEAGATVTLYDTNGTTVLGTATADSSGNWSITSSTLSSGAHTLTTKMTDAAGNTGVASAGLTVTIDTTAPSASGAPVLASASDSGSSNTDNLTNVTTPVITGSGAEAGATVTLYDTNGTTVLGTATADGSGNWSITSSTLSSGAHTLTTKVTDAAGNTGVASAGLTVTIDTTAPSASGTPDMASASDSGASSTDNITSVTTPVITGSGAEAGATVTLYDTNGTTVLGTDTADSSGNWSITSSTLSSGAHTLTTKVTDAASNTGAASAGLTVTIDTTPPSAIALSANSVMDVATGTNTSVATLSASDTQAVSYALVAGNGTNDAGNGSFVIVGGTLQSRSQLTAGTYNIRVGATDAAGNVSYQTFAITVNTNTAPTITSGTTATVAENAPITTVVYTATATDVDPGQTLSYSLSGPDAGSFDINASTGAVTLKNSANYETKSSYSFNLVATDNGTPNRADARAVTLTVIDVNDAPTGSLTINGTVKQGETLTVTDTLADEDGINGKTYQWYADGQPIAGANLSTFTLGQDQVGKVITVKASYTDGVGRQEVVSSTATVAVVNVNDPTTGEVSVGGQSGVGQTLTATNTLTDLDGLGTVSYQWQYKDASGQWQNITQTNGQLATGASYTVEPQLALKELRVKASYTDGQGTQEVMYSTANVKAGGLPPIPVVPTPTVATVAPVPQVVVVEPVKGPISTFISMGTVNAVPILAASPVVVIPVSVIPEQSAAQAAASVVSLGVSNPVGNATTGLRAVEATRDVVLERGEQASFTLPAGTFVHSDGAARVSLSARLADGRPLPNYVKFNPTTGTFTVEDTQGQATDLQVIVNAVDDKGSTASTTLVIKLKEKARNSSALDLPIKLGKLSLGEQIRLAEKPAGHLAELAALSKAFAANQTQRTHT